MADYANPQYPQAVNPLQNLSSAVGINNAVIENRLAQQQLQGQSGLANVYATAARNPDGSIDTNALMQRAPEVGVLAPKLIEQGYQQQLQQQAVQQQQIATARAKASLLGASLLPVLKNPKATPDDMIAALNTGKAASGGILKDSDYAPIFQQMANNLVAGGTVHDHAQAIVGQQLAMGGDLDAGSKLLYGAPVSLRTGGGTTFGTQNPTTGAVNTSSYIPDTLPATTTQKITAGPNEGETTYVGGSGPPSAQQSGAGGASSSGGQPGSITAELSPQANAALAETGKASGEQLTGDRAAASNSLNTLTNMKMAYHALENAPTGHGSAEVQNLKNFAIYAFPSLANTDFGKTAATYDLATSTLNDQARQLASQFGPKTNDNLDATFAAKPNTEQTKAAALALQEKIMSLTRANYAKTLFHDQPFEGLKTGNVQLGPATPENYQTWSENFNRLVDPVALGADLMPKQQLASYVKNLSSKPDTSTGLSPRDRFNNGYNLGVVYGLMDHVAGKPQSSMGQQDATGQ